MTELIAERIEHHNSHSRMQPPNANNEKKMEIQRRQLIRPLRERSSLWHFKPAKVDLNWASI